MNHLYSVGHKYHFLTGLGTRVLLKSPLSVGLFVAPFPRKLPYVSGRQMGGARAHYVGTLKKVVIPQWAPWLYMRRRKRHFDTRRKLQFEIS